MEIKKVTRFLILSFAVLSVLFYFLYRIEFANKNVLQQSFIDDAVANIKSENIDVSVDIIKKNIPDNDIYVFDVSTLDSYYESIIDAIISVIYNKSVTVQYFNVPEGVAAGIYDGHDDTKELSRIIFSKEDFGFSFSRKGFSMTGGDEPLNSSVDYEIDEKLSDTILKIITELSSDSGMSYRLSGISENDAFTAVSVIQSIDDKDINGVFLNFVFDDEGVAFIKGRWITYSPKAKYHNALVDGVNVLYMLDFENISAIHSENIVYIFRKGDNNRYFLIPGWEISYTDLNGIRKTVYFDAL